MNADSVKEAKAEAARFLRKCDAYLVRIKADDLTTITGSKESGALRRSSLDLTRSLANMRRPA